MSQPDKQELIRLVEGCRDAVVCSVDKEGFPNAKAMFRRANEGLKTFWFSSNNSAIRTARWLENPIACLYFVNPDTIRGLMLTGTMEVMTDDETRRLYWNEGDEKYYPLGPTDPDYCMLRFTAQAGNYYYGMGKCVFSLDELED